MFKVTSKSINNSVTKDKKRNIAKKVSLVSFSDNKNKSQKVSN